MMEAIFPPRPLTLKQRDFVRRCVDTITTIVCLYGFDRTAFSLRGTYDHWIYCASVVGDPMKFVKWKISSFYSDSKGQPLPPSILLDRGLDLPHVILGGRAYAYIQRVLRRQRPFEFESFALSILMSKKGMPRPERPQLKKAEAAAFAKLTTPVPLPSPVSLQEWGDVFQLPNSLLTQEEFSAQIRRTVREVFRLTEKEQDEGLNLYDVTDRTSPFFPSTSANYINTRSEGGVVGAILDHPELLIGLKTDEELIRTDIVTGKSGSQFMLVDDSRLRDSFTQLMDRIKVLALDETPSAVPLALPEALKTRVITKGPPYLYTLLKPLQKSIHSRLRQHPAFSLTGTPITADYVQERMGAKLPPGSAYLSVDYADATNELSSWCSDVCVDALAIELNLTEVERNLFLRALTGHSLEYSGKILPQRRGQLMGSIMSFPVLCLINAAIVRWSLEIAFKRVFTLRDAPMAINGDDAILKTTPQGRRVWEQLANFCGLSASVGKVYYSPEFLNMNSTTFNFHPEGWEGYLVARKGEGTVSRRLRHFQLVRYVNLGLLLGLTRSGGSASLVSEASDGRTFGTRARELLSSAPSWMADRLLGQFIHMNKTTLKAFNLPWFIPEALGGVGLPTTYHFQPRDQDLRLARKIYDNPSQFRLPPRPQDTPWQTWKYVSTRFTIPQAVYHSDFLVHSRSREKRAGVISESRLLGLACVEALFRAPKISSLYQEVTRDVMTAVSNYFRRVSGVWKRALLSQAIKMPEPFNMNHLPTIHDRSEWPIAFWNPHLLADLPQAVSTTLTVAT